MSLIFVLSFIGFTTSCILQAGDNKVKTDKIISSEQYLLDLTAKSLSNRIGRVVSDVLYLADRISAYDSIKQSLDMISRDLIYFCNRKRTYGHINLLDIQGKELLKIRSSSTGPYVIGDYLLSKTPEPLPYFSQALMLKSGGVFISHLGLLKEGGKLADPAQPEIIVSAPIYRNGKQQGVVAASYNAHFMLSEFLDIAGSSDSSMFLLNTAGYYLANDEAPEKDFAFMYDDRKNISFKAENPWPWGEIHKSATGSFKTAAGDYIYTCITPYNGYLESGASLSESRYSLQEGNWYAVSFLSKAKLEVMGITSTFLGTAAYIFKTHWMIFIGIILTSIAVGVLFYFNRLHKDEVRYFSEFDAMTGAYNRRAGVTLLEHAYREAMRDQNSISVCFLDIDGLKQVNDQLGHDAGDNLIMDVVGGIKHCIRRPDFIIRLGGDEFLIAFLHTSASQAEEAWQRIRNEYQRMNTTEQKPYLISASHGISEITPEIKRVIDEVLCEADVKMYAEKHLVKKALKVIREPFTASS